MDVDWHLGHCIRFDALSEIYLFMTEDALPNTPATALVRPGAETAMAMAINANMIAYSTIVTPFAFFFLCMMFSLLKAPVSTL